MQINTLFVYGTLKKAYHNHRLIEGCPQIGDIAVTRNPWPMYAQGIPYLIDCEGEGHLVTGELYEVTNPEIWQRLDRLEGHPNWYQRHPIEVVYDVSIDAAHPEGWSLPIVAWSYLMPERKAPDWRSQKLISQY